MLNPNATQNGDCFCMPPGGRCLIVQLKDLLAGCLWAPACYLNWEEKEDAENEPFS